MHSFSLRIVFVFLEETLLALFEFPVWWYSRGLSRTAGLLFSRFELYEHALVRGLSLPMLAWRFVVFALTAVCFSTLLLIYLTLPLLIVYGLLVSW